MTDRSASIEYRVLGPLEAVRLGEPVPLGGAKQRGVLALLLSRGGEIVPASRLIDEIWTEYPPATAGNMIRSFGYCALRAVRSASLRPSRLLCELCGF